MQSFLYLKHLRFINFTEDEEFEIEAMVDDFVTFFIAGQETTATTLTFLFMELAKNPEVLAKYIKLKHIIFFN